MINVIFGFAIAVVILLFMAFMINLFKDSCYINGIINTIIIISLIIVFSIIPMSNTLKKELSNKDIISGKAKYQEVLYITNENDTIKTYEIVRINEDTKK